jgi:hypothetical protein
VRRRRPSSACCPWPWRRRPSRRRRWPWPCRWSPGPPCGAPAPPPPGAHPEVAAEARARRDELATLLGHERAAAAGFLLALADFDRRRGWERLGHASLFAFLTRELGLSSGAAQLRLSAARLLPRHPAVEVALRSGRLCIPRWGRWHGCSRRRTRPRCFPASSAARRARRCRWRRRCSPGHSRGALRRAASRSPDGAAGGDPGAARPDVPAHVEREVRLRDGNRCQFPLEAGGVCGSTWQVELDHLPDALGEAVMAARRRRRRTRLTFPAVRTAPG